MKNIKHAIRTLALVAAVIMHSSWGETGHTMISFRINLSFNQEMSRFNDWVFYLSDHASDADKRKRDDPSEGPKHYIDIDNYSGFVENGTIPHSLADCISAFGAGFVEENGYLPWATLAMYDSVVQCMQREDWGNAKKYAADLGHYVADGHMPMHLTRNYDGQFTGNKGIHARYEIDMIGRYHDKIMYEGTPASSIDDPLEYIFSYIYQNYKYMDSILVADDYASEMGNGNTSEQYYMALWERTEHLTRTLFSNASHAIATLLYSAWNEAGRPGEDVTYVTPHIPGNAPYGLRIFPNPVENHATISYYNPSESRLTATVFDASGRAAMLLDGLSSAPGRHTCEWFPGHLDSGHYFLVLQSGNRRLCEPFTLLD